MKYNYKQIEPPPDQLTDKEKMKILQKEMRNIRKMIVKQRKVNRERELKYHAKAVDREIDRLIKILAQTSYFSS